MNKKLASTLNLSNIDMLDYRIAANFLETAGDLITELISYLTEVKEDKQIIELIKKTGESLEEMQTYSIEAFTKMSRDNAFKVIENYKENDTATTEIYTLSLHDVSDLGGRRIIKSEERRVGKEGRSRGSPQPLEIDKR